MIRENKINDISIKPLISHTTDPKKVLGGKYFIDPYSNVAIIAKKKSGKTTLLYNILNKVCRKGTTIIFFCSTINKDDTYKHILKMLEKKKCCLDVNTHFITEDKENIVKELLAELKNPDEIYQEPSKVKEQPIMGFGRPELDPFKKEREEKEKAEKKPRKPSKIAAEYVLVFDDLGADMRNKVITQLSKVLRHYKIRCFYLQQYLTDLEPACRKQLDYAILFKSFNDKKLKDIYLSLDLGIDYEDFVELYEYATKDKYNFLYVDVRNDTFRKNFNKELILTNNKDA